MKLITKKYVYLLKILLLIINVINVHNNEKITENNVSSSLSENKTLTGTKFLLENAKSNIIDKNEKKLRKFENDLQNVENEINLLKAHVKEKVNLINKALKISINGEINLKKLRTHSEAIKKSLKSLRTVDEKSYNKDKSVLNKIDELNTKINNHIKKMRNLETKKLVAADMMKSNFIDFENNYKTISNIKKMGKINELEKKSNKIKEFIKHTDNLKKTINEDKKYKEKLENEMELGAKDFKKVFQSIYSKIDSELNKEEKEFESISSDEDLIEKRIDSILVKENELDLLDEKDLSKIKQDTHKENEKETDELPRPRKEKIKDSHIKGKTFDGLYLTKKGTEQANAHNLILQDNLPKSHENISKKMINDRAFEINNQIKEIRDNITKNLDKNRELLSKLDINKDLNTLIEDQDAAKYLIMESLHQIHNHTNDLKAKSIGVLKNYYHNMKNVKNKEKDIKEQIKLFDATKHLDLNSVKLTGLYFDLKNLNKDNDKSTVDSDVKQRIDSIMNSRDKLYDDLKIISPNQLMRTSEEDSKFISFIENKTKKIKEEVNKDNDSLKEIQKANEKNTFVRELILKEFNESNKQMNIYKKNSTKTILDLVNQIDSNKKIIDSLDDHISHYKMFQLDENKFVGKLTEKLDDYKKRQQQEKDYQEMLNDLKNNNNELKNKLIKLTAEEKELKIHNNKLNIDNRNLSNENTYHKEDSQAKINDLNKLNQTNEKRIKELNQKIIEEENEIKSMTKIDEGNVEKINKLEDKNSQVEEILNEKKDIDIFKKLQLIDKKDEQKEIEKKENQKIKELKYENMLKNQKLEKFRSKSHDTNKKLIKLHNERRKDSNQILLLEQENLRIRNKLSSLEKEVKDEQELNKEEQYKETGLTKKIQELSKFTKIISDKESNFIQKEIKNSNLKHKHHEYRIDWV